MGSLHPIMATVTNIVVLTLAVIIAAQLHGAQSKRYPFPTNCTCRWRRLSRTCKNINDPDEYPDYDEMNFSGDCLPTVPPNQRLCYRLKVGKCGRNHECRFFDGIPGFRIEPLPVTGNGSVESVIIESLPRTEFKTVCFYNISLPNCTIIRLQHEYNHSLENYVDRLEGPNTNSNNTACKSYVKVYYETLGSQQYRTFCREDLATLDDLFFSSSLFLVYWTNSDRTNSGSFHLHAQRFE